MTLVWSAVGARAAPSSRGPQPGLPSDQAPTNPPKDYEKTQTLQWTPPQNSPRSGELLASPSRAKPPSDLTVGVHGGFLSGQILERSETETVSLLGGTLSWNDRPEHAWDFEVDVTATNCIRVGAARRFEIGSWTFTSSPYWSVGVTQTMQASRLLASIIDLERFKAMANIGFADLFEQNRQWTAEAGIGWGLTGLVVNLQIGWAHNW